ncbi:MAG: SpoVR family protein [Gammaproteobacteria bacterium]
MTQTLEQIGLGLEELGRKLGLDYYPLQFEEVPSSFMMEIAVYGLPVRMPHWSFGVRYIYQLVQHRMGNSRLFEVVFPGNPGRAYLAKGNSTPENALVIAHVLGHADFSKHNALFRRSQEEIGYHIVELAANHAQRISAAIEEHGQERVERVLDAALALEAHVDTFSGVRRERYDMRPAERQPANDRVAQRFRELPGEAAAASEETGVKDAMRLPPRPENDLLWFIANYAPEMEGWERDIFLAVREESFYFYPVFACQIMNEGWACYWHARLLREADFLSQQDYLDAIKTHSDVVRPHAAGKQVALAPNPYHLGFCMWEQIIEAHGIEKAFEIRETEDDFSFVRNYLGPELAAELEMFEYVARKDDSIEVVDTDIDALRDAILGSRYNFGAPVVAAEQVDHDGTLHLVHDHESDGRGLDLRRTERVLEYVQCVWRRNVSLRTVDVRGAERILNAPA